MHQGEKLHVYAILVISNYSEHFIRQKVKYNRCLFYHTNHSKISFVKTLISVKGNLVAY